MVSGVFYRVSWSPSVIYMRRRIQEDQLLHVRGGWNHSKGEREKMQLLALGKNNVVLPVLKGSPRRPKYSLSWTSKGTRMIPWVGKVSVPPWGPCATALPSKDRALQTWYHNLETNINNLITKLALLWAEVWTHWWHLPTSFSLFH